MSLRIRLLLSRDETTDGAAFIEAVQRAMIPIPRFPEGRVPVYFVISEAEFLTLSHTRAPEWADPNDSVLQWICERFKRDGLLGFITEDDDVAEECEADRWVLRRLQYHPVAYLPPGVKCCTVPVVLSSTLDDRGPKLVK